MIHHRILPLVLMMGAAGIVARGAEPLDFARDVYPLLVEHCGDCHGPDQQEGRLRLDARGVAIQGGISGSPVEPGRGAASLLVRRLRGLGGETRMPLDAEPLSDEAIATIERWIDEGAKWPDGVGPEVAPRPTHWAFLAPRIAAPPQVARAAWPLGPVDHFVLAAQESRGLGPSSDADRAVWLRRVSLDLIGLPPSPEEVDAFAADDRPGAEERVVDRLLASPRYGERWARPWLDLARYADTNGYQADQYRSVWPYRDWVIEAFNDDLPLDRFTLEQLAGDLLPDSTLAQRVATGFHRLTTCNVEAGVDPEENRVEQVIDRVNTTAAVWLGLTFECAQCHHHKYDPFTQRDYYGLLAFFNNTPLEVEGDGVTYEFVGPKMPVPPDAATGRRRAELLAKRAALQSRLVDVERSADATQPAWEQRTLELSPASSPAPAWHPLLPTSFTSEGGASHRVLDDHSILVVGEHPDKDRYTITAEVSLADVRGLRLELLTDESLPQRGPGRSNPPNVILHELELLVQTSDDATPRPVALTHARADYSQPKWDVAGAVDGKPATGWAIGREFGKPHWAEFDVAAADWSGGARLTIRAAQQFAGGRSMGRFRLAVRTGGAAADAALPADLVAALRKAPANRSDSEQSLLQQRHRESLAEWRSVRDELAKVASELQALPEESTLVMVEMPAGRETRVFRRGNFLDPLDPVAAATPRALHGWDPSWPRDRRGLARWLVDRRNPLVARVFVNRWWQEFFGRGLVDTPEDFGAQGEPCTHPEMLDYLAVRLMDEGWSMKAVHREIVLSRVYRQSSHVDPQRLESDPDNRWYSRGPRLRLDAETIRDQALAVAGLLSTRPGGPPVFPPQPPNIWRHVGRNAPVYATSSGGDRYRRGLYTFWRRSAPYPTFVAFDAPDRASCVVRRPRTNTPLQALALMNDPAFLELAAGLTRRMLADAGSAEDRAVVVAGFRRCLSRAPQDDEVAVLVELHRDERSRLATDPARVRSLLDPVRPLLGPVADDDAPGAAAWLLVANVLLSLDETITKN